MKRADFDRDKFISETWPEALESGEFKQGEGTLYKGPRASGHNRQKESEYCCLGVACELLTRMRLLRRSDWVGDTNLPRKARELLGLKEDAEYGSKGRNNLAKDNDSGKSFVWIANKIRQISRSKKAGFKQYGTP